MKVQDIEKVIENLINNKQLSAILLEGQWGIGKTYTVLEYLKTQKNCKVGYTSLFGKNNIDEINTELYRKLHPKQKVLETISHVVSLVGGSVSFGNVGISLNGTQVGQSKTIKSTPKYKTIVVLDDFERKDKNLDASALMGYFNDLTLQGIKVIVLSHFGEKLDESLGEYREKVFDRIYTISETQIDVARKLVEVDVDINENHLILAEHNLRMIIKANALFMQVKNYLEEKSVQDIDLKMLFICCLYVVVEALTNKITQEFIKGINKDYKKYYEENPKTARTVAIDASYRKIFGIRFEKLSLLAALFTIFESEDYALLNNLFLVNKEENLFKDSVFYLSDEQKIERIKKQYNYILMQGDRIGKSVVLDAVRGWYDYSGYLDFAFIDENRLFEELRNLGVDWMDGWHYEKAMRELFGRYRKFLERKEKEEVEIDLTLQDLSDNEKKERLKKVMREYNNYSSETKDIVKRKFIENNFYIESVHGAMTEGDWELAHSICYFISSSIPELASQIAEGFERYKEMHPKDLSLKHRLESLVKQYCFMKSDI